MLKLLAPLLAALTLAACVTAGDVPPVYGCEGLAEFGCPDSPAQPDNN